jgi:hypothetical protein
MQQLKICFAFAFDAYLERTMVCDNYHNSTGVKILGSPGKPISREDVN